MSILIDSPFLSNASTNYTSGYLAQITSGNENYAPLAIVDYGESETLTFDNPTTGEPIAVPENWQPTAVTASGQTFVPAQNPESPQNGEYIHNPYTNTIQVYASEELRSLIIYGSQQDISYAPPLLPPPYPQLFTSLPLQGTIQLNRQFEQQPSASFEFEAALSKSYLQQIFAPGTELDLYGIPLRINNISITELPRSVYPDARCKISVSLGSRWENYLDQPIFFHPGGRVSAPSNEPFQDLECSTSISSTTKKTDSTTVNSLLARAKIPYTGPYLAPVSIPADAPQDATVNPVQLLQERVRIANCFLRWSNASAVEAVRIDGSKVWSYSESDILGEVETSYEAISKLSKQRLVSIANLNPPEPDLINFPSTITPPPIPTLRSESPTALGFEYPNVELTGEFSQPKNKDSERTQGQSKPRYVRKPSKKEERVDGDKNAHEPLEGVASVQHMSLIFDLGGQTKTRSIVTIEDGADIRIVSEIWGFAVTALQIYDSSIKKIKGSPGECWKCLKKVIIEYIYEPKTGYLLYVKEDGYNTVRFRQESPTNPETLDLKPSDPDLKLYEFRQIPVVSRTSYLLKLMPEYTFDGAVEYHKSCNKDGTSTIIPILNPNYAPPYYVEYEHSESVAFASRPNPDNPTTITADTKLLPDLIVGEESRFESYTQVTKATYKETLTGFEGGYPVYKRGEELSPQKAVRYIKKFKAQGEAIASALEEISIEESTGELPVAKRRPPLFVREEQPSSDGQPDTPQEDKQNRYLIQTQGYTSSDPINGSESFPAAKTLNEALTGARCKLAIENWRTGLTERLQIPGNLSIIEGDRFNYLLNGEYRQRIVLSASTTLNILGVVNGQPRVTAVTSLILGRYVLPSLNYTVTPLPKDQKSSQSNKQDITVTLDPMSQNLGQLIDWSKVKSRRNP